MLCSASKCSPVPFTFSPGTFSSEVREMKVESKHWVPYSECPFVIGRITDLVLVQSILFLRLYCSFGGSKQIVVFGLFVLFLFFVFFFARLYSANSSCASKPIYETPSLALALPVGDDPFQGFPAPHQLRGHVQGSVDPDSFLATPLILWNHQNQWDPPLPTYETAKS